METAVIGHRVADFLKKHAPFNAIDDADLLALASNGRVRFYEPNEYILWQGEPHRTQVFVIQQGTVSLWEESADEAKMRDVRGAGDMLGIERYNDAPACLYTARSESDVVVYAFPAMDFDAFVLKYRHAVQYVAAESRVTHDYRGAGERLDVPQMFLHDLVGRGELPRCSPTDTIADAARRLLTTRSAALIIVDADNRPRGVLSADTVLSWVAGGAGSAQQTLATLVHEAPATVAPTATVADGLLTMGSADVDAVAITNDGTADGHVQALVTKWDLTPLFGDNPHALLSEARVAANTHELCRVNQRTRAFILEHLDGAASVEWLAQLAGLVDGVIVSRVAEIAGLDSTSASLCVSGATGRSESLTLLAPILVGVFDDEVPDAVMRTHYQQVLEGLLECGYLPRVDLPFEPPFYAATVREWRARYRGWIEDPVRQQTYRVRSLFDMRPVWGRPSRWQELETAVTDAVTPDFVYLLANDCLASLPPLTFFEDAVIDSSGEHTTTFRLEHSALRPLVDVGRVFALAAKNVFGRSTIERFAIARRLLPEQDAIFREAADTLRIVLWQQGRVGITESTSGAELPAALLSRYDRRALKSGFRSILQLLEFTADLEWLKRL